jgi:hypothetical protein
MGLHHRHHRRWFRASISQIAILLSGLNFLINAKCMLCRILTLYGESRIVLCHRNLWLRWHSTMRDSSPQAIQTKLPFRLIDHPAAERSYELRVYFADELLISRTSRVFSCSPIWISGSTPMAFCTAVSRICWVRCMLQKCGPHIEQK